MSIISKLAAIKFNKRLKELENITNTPIEVQSKEFEYLASNLTKTLYAQDYGVTTVPSYSTFCDKIPVVTYDDLSPRIESVMKGEWQNLLYEKPLWYAKSSGTTNDYSKYIPTTDRAYRNCHLKGLMDVTAIYFSLYPDGAALDGKVLTLGGSLVANELGGGGVAGDLSGILVNNQPSITDIVRIPARKHALLSNFEQKIEYIIKTHSHDNVTSFAGVPVWYMVLANKILEYTGKSNMCELWPNISLFAHGGTSFAPYKERFKELFPSDNMKYLESYNASEGFFAIADDNNRDDMALMLDYNIFYEFLETAYLHDTSKCVPLEGVKAGVNYAIIITTSSGLWRYMIGDTVEFTSTSPYRIKITGRTKHFINMAGEEVIIDNAEQAFNEACQKCDAQISEYSGAPLYHQGEKSGAHQWFVEFDKIPANMDRFIDVFDLALQSVNSDYTVKRTNNMALGRPIFITLPKGSFYRWMSERGRLGGQNKIPRLANNRNYADSLLQLINKTK